jgi:hypothetical protein
VAKVPLNPNSRIYLDEFDLSGVLNSITQNVDQATPVVTCISDAGPRRIVANYEMKANALGFFEPTDDGYDEQIWAMLNDGDTDHYLTHLFGASAIGNVAYDMVARISGQPRSAAVGGAILLNYDTEGANGIVRGLVLGNKTTTGAESLTGQNQGVTTAGTIYAVIFRVLTFNGTNITLKVQESSDDGAGDAYADIAGLTSGALTDIGVVRATTVAATEAWKRLDISGTFTSCAIVVTAGTVQGSVPPV